ncbi:copper resistance protein [Mytilinidion resinicola]|uniref:Copper resistance protein n=1 Tax=Mytilinidion resinicola TaxID=574789 RepID=A0A6A6Z107_9PEZI|nr:copper resistance protein [Mytilinidion resinicola]KAF2814478.1 copper resistance protein [Mytilinidion resinicola]
MSAPTGTVPSTCCGRSSGDGCACAKEATCSCGKKSALHCDCEKSSTENTVSGARCSCNQRAQGACTCGRAGEENKGAASSLETDFTTKK